MNPRITEKEWRREFRYFVSSEGTSIPENISQNLLSYVYRELNPSPWIVFAKLMGIHAVIGTFSLAICDQFGMNPFKTGISLSEYFMKFGHSACMAFCGFLFVGLSVNLALVIFKREEFSVLQKNSWIQIPSLALLSLMAFIGFGAELVLSISLLWLLGAMLGGFTPIFIRKLKIG